MEACDAEQEPSKWSLGLLTRSAEIRSERAGSGSASAGWPWLGVDPASISRKVPKGEFTFLGYSFGRMHSAKTGKAYLGYYIRHVKSPVAWIVSFTRCARGLTWDTFESSAKARDVKRPSAADSSSSRHPSAFEGVVGCGLGAADRARNRASAPNQFGWIKRFEGHRMLPHSPLISGDAASACSWCGKRGRCCIRFTRPRRPGLPNNPGA
jgi:hypothetical protein